MPKSDLPAPQLARLLFSIDDSSDEDNNSQGSSMSLEIMAPTLSKQKQPAPMTTVAINPATAATNIPKKKKPADYSSTTKAKARKEAVASAAATTAKMRQLAAELDTSDSSDDEDLFSKNPFAPGTTGAKATVTATVTTKSKRPPKKSQKSSAAANAAAREERKRQQQEQKRLDKEARAFQREQDKRQREHDKRLAKQSKKRQRQEEDQAAGKFSHDEVAILIDSVLYNNNTYRLTTYLQDEDTFMLQDYSDHAVSSGVGGAIQWIRQDALQGGAQAAWDNLQATKTSSLLPRTYEVVPNLLLILTADDMVPLLRRDANHTGDDYPRLEQWLRQVRAKWKLCWKTKAEMPFVVDNNGKAAIVSRTCSRVCEPQTILVLDRVPKTLDKMWVDHRKQQQQRGHSHNERSSLPTEWNLHDALQWILIQFQVESILCSSVEAVQTNIHKYTRAIAEARYAAATTELDCIKKLKSAVPQSASAFDKAHDAWIRMLQQIPGVSETRSRRVAEQYPTIQDLWQTYQTNMNNQQEDRNPALLAIVLGGASERACVKLSGHIYRVLTSTDPNEMVL